MSFENSWLHLLGELACRDEQFEARAPDRVLRDGRRRFRVARPALSVDHLDVRRRAFAKRDVGDADDLIGLLGRAARMSQCTLGGGDRFPGGPNVGARLSLRIGLFGPDASYQ